jgi:hypothetical protein
MATPFIFCFCNKGIVALHRGIVGLQCDIINGQKGGIMLRSEVATPQSNISR